MTIALALLVQSVLDVPAAAPRAAAPGPITRDARSCPESADGEIVVCGRRDDASDRYRLPPPGPERESALPRAAFNISGNVSGAVEAEQAEILPGLVSRRLMVRVKVPF